MKSKLLFLVSILFISLSSYSQNALDFDGNNDYISGPTINITGSAARTVEAWVKTTSNALPSSQGGTGQKVILNWGTFTTGGRFTFSQLQNNSIRIEVGGNGMPGTIAINDGNWHHVACVFDPLATNQYSLYIDGVLNVSGNLTVSTNTTSGPLLIGRRVDGINYFDGSIDEVRIWNTALTASQLSTNKDSEFCANQPNLVAYYKLNHGVANGNNATSSIAREYVSGTNSNLSGFALTGTSSNWVSGPSSVTGSTLSGGIDTANACAPYILPSGKQLLTSGLYLDTTTSAYGCDSTYSVNYTAIPSSSATINEVVCDGYYAPSGKLLTLSGTYLDTLNNHLGCDSLITINLTVKSTAQNIHTISSCKTYTSATGNILTSSGTYTDTLTSFNGCDSVIITLLTITSDVIQNFQPKACDSYTSAHGSVWTTSGNYSDTVITGTGCDSIFNYQLTIGNSNTYSFNVVECDVTYISELGNSYTATGTYTETTTNNAGCDSVITIHLTIGEDKLVQYQDTACRKLISPSGKVWSTGGWHNDTIPTIKGCDSALQVFVVIKDIDNGLNISQNILTASQNGASYQWLDCDANQLIPNETARKYVASSNGNYAVIVSDAYCTDTSACVQVTGIGIERPSDINQIRIYPNPADQMLHIVSDYETTYRLFSVTGKEIELENTISNKLFIGHLNPGVYLLRFENEHGILHKKLIINRE